MVLVERAIGQRALDSASAAAGYRARAHGVVAFLLEVGTPTETTRLLKADELEVEVYWQGRGRSKQVIRAWRDTSYFPTGTVYHRDHLGIVTDDFGDLIRIGQGDEIRELPHPLSPGGPALYQYQIRDSIRVRAGERTITLVRIDVRPRDPGAPLAVGTVSVDGSDGSLVRSRFSFTAAAYRDPDLQDIVVQLERSLVDGRWLPYRQELEITRRSAVVEFPLATKIRSRWTIDDFELGTPLPGWLARAAPIGGLSRPSAGASWERPLAEVVDSAAAAAGPDDVAAARREIARLARGALLDGLPGFRLSAERVSDLVRVNRVEGLRLGAGLGWRLGRSAAVRAGFGFGTVDERLTGRAELTVGTSIGRIELEGSRLVVDVGAFPLASGVAASLLAQEGGLDLGDYVLLERIAARWRPAFARGLAVEGAREWSSSVVASADPARGSYRDNPDLGSDPQWIGRVELRRSSAGEAKVKTEGVVDLEVGSNHGGYARLVGGGRVILDIGRGVVEAWGYGAAATSQVPVRRSFAIGGWGTLPGEPFRAFGGRMTAWAHLEGRVPLPAPSLPLGVFGGTAPRMEVGPFLAVGWAGRSVSTAWPPSLGLRPVGGLAVELFDHSLRLELGLPLRGPSRWGMTVDLSRAWWPVL